MLHQIGELLEDSCDSKISLLVMGKLPESCSGRRESCRKAAGKLRRTAGKLPESCSGRRESYRKAAADGERKFCV